LIESFTTKLFCHSCDKETAHSVEYVSGILKRIKCEECGYSLDISREKLLKYYTEEVISRFVSKPDRLTEEVRKDLSHFVFSLPFRLLSKPYRVAKELRDILKK